MTRTMFGPLILLAASVSPPAQPVSSPATAQRIAAPASRSTATATATIRVVSGVSFGKDKLAGAELADRRKAQLTAADGLIYPAELLEFQ